MLSEEFGLEAGDRVYLKDEGVKGYVHDIRFSSEYGVNTYKVFDDNGREFVYFSDRDIEKESFDLQWCQMKSELGL